MGRGHKSLKQRGVSAKEVHELRTRRDGTDEAMFRRYNRWHSRFDQPDPSDDSSDDTTPNSDNLRKPESLQILRNEDFRTAEAD
jgi:hypothetical protein